MTCDCSTLAITLVALISFCQSEAQPRPLTALWRASIPDQISNTASNVYVNFGDAITETTNYIDAAAETASRIYAVVQDGVDNYRSYGDSDLYAESFPTAGVKSVAEASASVLSGVASAVSSVQIEQDEHLLDTGSYDYTYPRSASPSFNRYPSVTTPQSLAVDATSYSGAIVDDLGYGYVQGNLPKNSSSANANVDVIVNGGEVYLNARADSEASSHGVNEVLASSTVVHQEPHYQELPNSSSFFSRSVDYEDFTTMCCGDCSGYSGLNRFRCFAQCESGGDCLNVSKCAFFGDAAADGVHKTACRRASETCGVALFNTSFFVDEQTCFDVAAGQCIATVRRDFDLSLCGGYDPSAHNCWRDAYHRAVRVACGRS